MNTLISEALYKELSADCDGRDLNSLWFYLQNDFKEFSLCRDAFFWIVKRWLEDGVIKLENMRSHVPMTGSIDEQISQFRQSFPKTEAEMEGGLWFFDVACPVGSTWQLSLGEDGQWHSWDYFKLAYEREIAERQKKGIT